MENLFRATIAMAAVAALLVTPSIASASPELTSPTGTQAPVGTKFIATNVEHATTPKNFVTTTPVGNMSCASATITGEVVQNSGTNLVGTISTFELNGTPAINPSASHCSGPGGILGSTPTITPNHTSNPTHNGVASLPWCIKFNAEDTFSIFGEVEKGCTSGQTRPIIIVYHYQIGACYYEKSSIEGTYTTHPSDAALTINKQEFKRVTGSGFCPASFQMDLALTLSTDVGGAGGEALYIK